MNSANRLATCIGLTVTIVTLCVSSVIAQGGDQAAINRRVDGLYEALAKADLKTYVASLHKDAVRAIGTSIAVGRPQIEKAVAPVFARGALPIKFTRHGTRLLSPTTAIVHGVTEDATTTPPLKGHAIFTLVKEGDDWLIAAFQTATAPAP